MIAAAATRAISPSPELSGGDYRNSRGDVQTPQQAAGKYHVISLANILKFCDSMTHVLSPHLAPSSVEHADGD